MPKALDVQRSAITCACGETLKRSHRPNHWRTCEPFRQACAAELMRIRAERGTVSSKVWNSNRASGMPAVASMVNAFGSWSEFTVWAGVAERVAMHICICGFASSHTTQIGQHNRDCMEYRVWLIDELERIYKAIEHEPDTTEWDQHRQDEYPRHEAITRVWSTWMAFQSEVLRRERMDKTYVDETLPTDGLAVSSVRTVGKEVYYMLR